MRKLFLSFVLAMLAIATGQAALAAAVEPPRPLSAAEWRADLAFMMREIQTRHASPYHKVSRAELEAAAAKLHAEIPAMERNEIIVGMMRIAAMVGDGHTRVEPRKDPAFGFRSLPVKLYLFDDGLFVRAAQPEHRDLLGARVEAVGGVPIAEALKRVAELASGENDMGWRLYAPLYLAMPDVLEAIGLSSSQTSAMLTLTKGQRRWTVTVPAGDVAALWPPDTDVSLATPDGWLDARTAAQPSWLQAPLDYHRLIPLPARQALYAQVNMITDLEGQTLGQFGEKILRTVTAINPKALILDLRLSQGGNGELRGGLVRSLIKAEDGDTRLYVLTARGTFSASQFIMDDLDRLTDAVFVGEPASSSPSGYGDAYRSQMPNSKITVRTSTLRWQSGQNFAPWTYIDVAVPYRFADYAAGRDPALDAAVSMRAPVDLAKALESLPAEADERSLKGAITDILDDRARLYSDKERALIRAANALARAKRPGQALLVAAEAARRFPRSAWAAFYHALMADGAGDTALAEAAARRALSIDRNHRNARSLLEKVTGNRA